MCVITSVRKRNNYSRVMLYMNSIKMYCLSAVNIYFLKYLVKVQELVRCIDTNKTKLILVKIYSVHISFLLQQIYERIVAIPHAIISIIFAEITSALPIKSRRKDKESFSKMWVVCFIFSDNFAYLHISCARQFLSLANGPYHR